MKVCHVFKIKAICGSENHLLTLLPRLAAGGAEIAVVMMHEPKNPVPEFSSRLERHGIDVFRVKIGCDLSLPALLKVVRILKSEKPDIVHTHLIHGDLYGTLAAKMAGIEKIVSSKHNDDRFRRRLLLKQLNRYLNRKAKRIIVISEALKNFTIRHERIDPGKVAVIYYGLKDFEQSLNDKNLREKLGYKKEDIVFGIIARLTEQKGHRYLLEAFRAVGNKHRQARLLIVGDGELREELERLAHELHLGRQVRFLGRREDTADIYHALDVFIHPSLWEGFGLVFLEAMSFSLPIIATRVSAIPELVLDGETGLLVPPKDIRQLVSAMTRMIEQPQERERIGSRGRQRLLSDFGHEKMVAKTVSLYEKILT